MTPEFSVVIPTYGRPQFVDAAIRSVLGQSVSDLECIVVDDASPEPVDLAPDGLLDDPRLRLVRRDDNGGPAAARNTGIDAAVGKYVAFLDDDDLWLPDRLLDARRAHERAPVAVCWQSSLGDDTEALPAGRVLEGNVHDIILDAITPHLGATSILRSSAPKFDERYDTCEDVDWWLRVSRDLTVATAQSVGMAYRTHDTVRTRTGAPDRLTGARMLLDEHADWFRDHPRAKAFRLKRMGLTAQVVGDRGLALRCFASSFRLQPEPRTAWHALRTLPGGLRPPRAGAYASTPSARA